MQQNCPSQLRHLFLPQPPVLPRKRIYLWSMMWKTAKSQWPECEAFIDRFLLGKEDVNTNVTKAEKFEGTTDLDKWIKF